MNPTYEELLAAHKELLERNAAQVRAVASLSLENGTNEYKRIEAEKDRAHDPLTKLLNRRGGEEMFEKMLSAAKRDESLVGMILIDLDYFKKVNDTYGHPAGDAVLREVAQRMALRRNDKVLREEDIAMRWGGEEFAILFTTESSSNAASIAERLRTAIAKKPVDIVDKNRTKHKLNVTASFGVTVCNPYDIRCTTSDMASEADAALYESKNSGRNRVTLWEPEKEDTTQRTPKGKKKRTLLHNGRVLSSEEVAFLLMGDPATKKRGEPAADKNRGFRPVRPRTSRNRRLWNPKNKK